MTTGIANAASYFGKPIKLIATSTTLGVPANKNHVHLSDEASGGGQNIDWLSTPNNPAGRVIRFMGTSDADTVTFRDNQATTNLNLNGTSVTLSNGEYLELAYDETNDQWNQLGAAGSEVSEAELEFLNGAVEGAVTASKCVVANAAGAVVDADLILDSTNEINVQIGAVTALAIDNAAIASNAAATDTVGQDVFIETQDAGGTATAARVGGAFSFKSGDGSAGAAAVVAGAGGAVVLTSGLGGAATGTAAGGAGGAVSLVGSAGGAHTGGGATGAGGAGGAYAITAGAGGATSNVGSDNGGAGGTVTITAGAGGAASAGTGDGGASGDINLVVSAGGTTTGGSAGSDGYVKFGGAASWTANATATVTISNVAPAAVGTATISKWLTVKDNADGVFYIPVWT